MICWYICPWLPGPGFVQTYQAYHFCLCYNNNLELHNCHVTTSPVRMQTIILQFFTEMQLTSLKLRPTICDQTCQKGSYTCTSLRHTFHPHLLAISVDQWHMFLIQLKVEQSTFSEALSQACLTSTSAQLAFEWPNLPLASRHPTVNHRKAGWWAFHGFSCFVWHPQVKMAPMEVIRLFLEKT